KFNPQVDAAILRLAVQAREAAGVIDELAGALLTSAVRERGPNAVRLDPAPLRAARPYLAAAAFRRLWTAQDWPRQRMGTAEGRRLVDLLADDAPPAWDLPCGVRWERGRRGGLASLVRAAVQGGDLHR